MATIKEVPTKAGRFERIGAHTHVKGLGLEKGKPVVKVETHGDVDVAELQRDIQQRYPGAKIEGLEKQPLIRVVGEEETKQKTEKKTEEKKRKEEKKKEPLIRIVE